jgi:hypothetical protein
LRHGRPAPLCATVARHRFAPRSPGHRFAPRSPGHRSAPRSPGHRSAPRSPGHRSAPPSPSHSRPARPSAPAPSHSRPAGRVAHVRHFRHTSTTSVTCQPQPEVMDVRSVRAGADRSDIHDSGRDATHEDGVRKWYKRLGVRPKRLCREQQERQLSRNRPSSPCRCLEVDPAARAGLARLAVYMRGGGEVLHRDSQ